MIEYPNGIAVSLKIEEETGNAIREWAKEVFEGWYPIYVPQASLMHVSLVVTGRPVTAFQPLGQISAEATILGVENIKTRDGNGALVAKLDCSWIVQRRNEVLGLCEVPPTKRRTITPHLTIAYNWRHGGWRPTNKTPPFVATVRFVEEICEPFNPRWFHQNISSL